MFAAAKQRTVLEVAALAGLTLLLWLVPVMVSQGQYDPAPVSLADPALPAADRAALAEADTLALALAGLPQSGATGAR